MVWQSRAYCVLILVLAQYAEWGSQAFSVCKYFPTKEEIMQIRTKRIINPQRYLYTLHPGDKFYIAVPLEAEDYPRLQSYGILPDSPARIPIPRKAATRVNANGKWKLIRDLPKEERFFEHDYHVVDWHGTDHYGTCWQSRWCYQRELIPPTELAFIIEGGGSLLPVVGER